MTTGIVAEGPGAGAGDPEGPDPPEAGGEDAERSDTDGTTPTPALETGPRKRHRATAHLGHKVSYGSITGFIRARDDPSARFSFVLYIDGQRIGQFTANSLSRALMKKRFGDGMYGFRVPIPDAFLDGEVHRYLIRPPPGDRPFKVAARRVRFPKQLGTAKPWVAKAETEATTGGAELDEPHRDLLRQVEAAPTLAEAAAIARRGLDGAPGLADRPLGLADRLQREGVRFRPMSESLAVPDWAGEARRRVGLTKHKASMRALAERLGIPVAAIIWKGTSVDDLRTVALPARFVAKRDGLSGTSGVALVHNGYDLIHRQAASRDDLDRWLRHIETKRVEEEFYSVEEFLVQEGASEADAIIPLDYKMYCFGGKARFIQVIDRNGLGGGKGRETWYTRDWRRTSEPLNHYYDPGDPIARPQCLDELLAIGDRMSSEIGSFVRIDAFCTTRGAVFGEMSFSPFGGREFTPHGNMRLGELWHIYYG